MTASRPDNEAVFHAARAIPDPDRRRHYLHQACGSDQARIAFVEALLAAADHPDSLLDRPAGDLADTLDEVPPGRWIEPTDTPPGEGPGSRLGPYKLLELIGEGGMGSVWLAEQTEPIQRRVAVKVVKEGMDSRQVLARFEAERQALALMEHPNIAKVLDAGKAPSGRPYFVMELVKGQPITRYCDDKRLGVRERLELFADVCRAVQHAHQKGVIHRDIKPSNILVAPYDGRPVVKVIDFGLAKATGQHLTEQTLFTGFGAVVGTPEYMSPEQAEVNNQDIDTRSDIYSLGVLLYELLTGSTPLTRRRLKETPLLEVLRVIREEEPPRPSRRLSESAEALPSVAAQRQTEPAKLTRQVRGELDWIVMKALEKDRNRRYETANDFAMDVQRYLADEPVVACPPSVGYRLRKFVRRNRGGLAVAALVLVFLASLGGVAGWMALQQEAQQKALETDVGRDLDEVRTFCRQDRLREASAVLDHAQALAARSGSGDALARQVAQVRADVDMASRVEAIRVERSAVKDEHFDGEGSAPRYAEAFRDYGLDVDQLDPHEAAARIEGSVIREQLVAALDDWLLSASGSGRRRLLAVLAEADADPWRQPLRAACVEGNPRAVLELARRANPPVQPPANAVLMWRALHELGKFELSVEFLRRAQQAHPGDFWLNQDLGVLLTHLKSARPGEAVGYLRAAVALRPSPGVFVNLGNALRAQGDLPSAIAAYRKAIDLKSDYATAHNNLGNSLRQQGDLPGAIAAYRKAIDLKSDYATAHNNLGVALQDQGDLAGAIAAYRKAVDLVPDFAQVHSNLGAALHAQGDLPGAIAAYRKAIDQQPDFATAHSNLGNVLREHGDLPGAIAACRKAIALKPDDAKAHNNLGAALQARGDLPGAVAACQKAIALKPDFASPHNNLGLALHAQGDLAGAVAAYRKAIDLEPNFAQAYNNLGITLSHQNDLPGASAAYRKAIALKRDYANAYGNLGNALHDQGDLAGAVTAYRKAIALQPKNSGMHYNLGGALRGQGDLAGAVTAYRKAIDLEPDFAEAHCNLGLVLQRQGQLARALEALRRGHELGARNPRWPYPSARWVREGEHLLTLDRRWPDFVAGKAAPASPGERIQLAQLCALKELNRAALRYYEEAFAAQPALLAGHRYNAACIAALAGCGQGQDADKLDDRERARLRSLARDWLCADLEARGRLLDKVPARFASPVARDLQHWLADPDFVGLREPEALARLPEAERQAWQKLWKDVAAMLTRAQEKTAPQKK